MPIDELDSILNNHFLNDFRTGYITFNNHVMPEYFKTISTEISNLKVYNDDIWICSFPKTGTTWTQEMVWMIMNNLDFEGGQQVLADRFPFLEVTSLFDFTSLRQKIKEFNPPETLTDSVGTINKLKSPRFIKTHLPWTLLPKQLKNSTQLPKIIYVARNPKDTCVSYFHHCRLIEGYTGNFEDFCKLFLGGRLCFAPYIKHILSYWEKRHQENILFLKFEEMKKDLPAAIRKVAKFLERNLTEDQIKILEKHLSFESMKVNKAVNYESIVELNRTFNLTDHDGSFMRTGSVGSFKAVMTSELIEEFDNWTRENLKGTGFTFDI